MMHTTDQRPLAARLAVAAAAAAATEAWRDVSRRNPRAGACILGGVALLLFGLDVVARRQDNTLASLERRLRAVDSTQARQVADRLTRPSDHLDRHLRG